MARPGFHHRLRAHLASDNFEDKINGFMAQHAALVVKGCQVRRCEGGGGRADSKGDGARRVVEDVEYSPEAHDTWRSYLELIENHMEILKEAEGLDPAEFKQAIEEVGDHQPVLLRLVIHSWEFTQFFALCRDHIESMHSGRADEKAPSRRGSDDKEGDAGGEKESYK